MILAVNAAMFDPAVPPAQQLAVAKAAGFDGVELILSANGALGYDTPVEEFQRLREEAAAQQIEIVGLASADWFDVNYAAPGAADRALAQGRTRAMLLRAAACGAGAVLVIPGVIGKASEPRGRVSYADALRYAHAALSELRHLAEDCGVTLALENAWTRFLYSPVELTELIDRVNSPCVGAYLDVGNVMAFGDPLDWIQTLGARLARVHVKDYDVTRPGWTGFCPLGEGSVDWPAVLAALRAQGYGGPLTFDGRGDLSDAAARMRRTCAGAAEPAA